MVGTVPGTCDTYNCRVTPSVEMTMVAGLAGETSEYEYCTRHALGIVHYAPFVDWLTIESWKMRFGQSIPHPEHPPIPWPEDETMDDEE